MAPKQTWGQRLKKWQKDRDETLAKSLMSPPEATTILQGLRFPGVAVIMGSRGSGKTGLAYEIMQQFHTRKHLGGAVLLPQLLPPRMRKVLPKWVVIVTSIANLPKNSVCIIDEAATTVRAMALENPPRNHYDVMNLITYASSHLLDQPRQIARAQKVAAVYDDPATHARVCPVCQRSR